MDTGTIPMGKQRLTIVLAYECVQILDRLGTALQTQRSGRRDDRAKPHPPSSGFSAVIRCDPHGDGPVERIGSIPSSELPGPLSSGQGPGDQSPQRPRESPQAGLLPRSACYETGIIASHHMSLSKPPPGRGARHESDVGGEDQRTSGIGTRLSDSYNNCQTGGSSCLKTLPPKSNWNNGASS